MNAPSPCDISPRSPRLRVHQTGSRGGAKARRWGAQRKWSSRATRQAQTGVNVSENCYNFQSPSLPAYLTQLPVRVLGSVAVLAYLVALPAALVVMAPGAYRYAAAGQTAAPDGVSRPDAAQGDRVTAGAGCLCAGECGVCGAVSGGVVGVGESITLLVLPADY